MSSIDLFSLVSMCACHRVSSPPASERFASEERHFGSRLDPSTPYLSSLIESRHFSRLDLECCRESAEETPTEAATFNEMMSPLITR